MTIKITAAATSVCVALLFVFATIYPNDPYFYALASSTLAVTISRLVLSLLLVRLAFKKKFKTVYGPSLLAALSVLLATFGLVGLLVPDITYSLFNWFKPMDFVFSIEAALVLGLAVASVERGKGRLPALHLSRLRPRPLSLASFDLSMLGLITKSPDS